MDAKYVPIEDVAKHLSVSISTIRGWIRRKYIPDHTYIKVGNTYRFSIDDVVSALSSKPDVADVVNEEWENIQQEDL
jgi:excisionase family DNA binding protein|tara:strand:- start:88 stop:318 length:231 start_codon:yes stop_codon:yes gene_type:complete